MQTQLKDGGQGENDMEKKKLTSWSTLKKLKCFFCVVVCLLLLLVVVVVAVVKMGKV